jgi:chitinase
MPRRLRLVTAAAVAAAAVSLSPLLPWPASAASANPFPAHVSAPYVDTGLGSVNGALSGSTLSTIANNYGNKFFTLAFVDGSGCQWSMYNSASYQTQLNNLRGLGGDAIISFGGWTSDNGGTDLGNSCSSASAAATQMENVVTYFNASHLDFDIEASALSNHTDVDRTNSALALVRSWASSNGRALSISYTLPVLPGGLTSDGMFVLTNGKSHGFTPNVVNIMAMDYGTSGTEMGTAAEQALDASAGQVASTYGISSSAAYAKMGVTPMIGQNDSAGEIFTLSDASTVESYAASKGIALVSFWSEGRDNGGCPGQTSASSTCSGVSQSTGQFTTTFNKFTGGTSGGGGGFPTGYHQLVVNNDSLCVDVSGASLDNNAAIIQWTCKSSGNTNQEFQFNPVSNGYGELQNENSGKDIVVQSASTSNGAKIIQYTQNGTTNGLWLPIALSNGSWQFKNLNSGLCLDVTGASTSTGVQLQQWTCKSSAAGTNQGFALR